MVSYRELRHHDELGGIDVNTMPKDPFDACQTWIDEAVKHNCYQANAMVLATVNEDSQPSTRVVLLKDLSKDGLIFYSNYDSRKAQDINDNDKVALNFYWDQLERQIRIEGTISKTSTAISDDYFNSRPAASNISAIASPQSQEIPNREWLEQRCAEVEQRNGGENPPRPDNWGGYIVKPHYFEFWQGRPNRLHDRIAYQKVKTNWERVRLAP